MQKMVNNSDTANCTCKDTQDVSYGEACVLLWFLLAGWFCPSFPVSLLPKVTCVRNRRWERDESMWNAYLDSKTGMSIREAAQKKSVFPLQRAYYVRCWLVSTFLFFPPSSLMRESAPYTSFKIIFQALSYELLVLWFWWRDKKIWIIELFSLMKYCHFRYGHYHTFLHTIR